MSEPKNFNEGQFSAPPPNAPHEVAQPIRPETFDAQLAAAAANEQTLPPFDPKPMPVVQDESSLAEAVRARHASVPRGTHQPAASETDSPSRGIPRDILDPGKQITGGFGSAQEAQYYPLDGSEAKQLALQLMDQLAARIENDLRFHPAIVYPRLTMRVVIEVEGYTDRGNFDIQQVLMPGTADKTPLEIARTRGDQVAFVLVEQRREFAPDGTIEAPPDLIRDELQLEKPHKQMIQTGAGRMIVDRSPSLDGSF